MASNAGLYGCPTTVNNVETFAAAAHIVDYGADWFAAMGVPGSTGTRLLSVSGDCAAPGIYEVEWGTTLRSVLGGSNVAELSMFRSFLQDVITAEVGSRVDDPPGSGRVRVQFVASQLIGVVMARWLFAQVMR